MKQTIEAGAARDVGKRYLYIDFRLFDKQHTGELMYIDEAVFTDELFRVRMRALIACGYGSGVVDSNLLLHSDALKTLVFCQICKRRSK